MKKTLISLMAASLMTSAFTMFTTKPIYAEQMYVEENRSATTLNAKSTIPQGNQIPFYRGGFSNFNAVATNGNEGMYNMVRATISHELYYGMENMEFFGNSKLGNKVGDSVSGRLVIHSTPEKFFNANFDLELGYIQHRGWNNVWRYQRSGNLGAGMHDRSRNMARIAPFPEQRIRTIDGTIEAILNYTINNTILVTFVRLQTPLVNYKTNLRLSRKEAFYLPIEIGLNRWNGPGTRVNDYISTDNVNVIENNNGPIAWWDLEYITQ